MSSTMPSSTAQATTVNNTLNKKEKRGPPLFSFFDSPFKFLFIGEFEVKIISEFALINAFPCEGRWMRATRINTYNLNVGEQTDE